MLPWVNILFVIIFQSQFLFNTFVIISWSSSFYKNLDYIEVHIYNRIYTCKAGFHRLQSDNTMMHISHTVTIFTICLHIYTIFRDLKTEYKLALVWVELCTSYQGKVFEKMCSFISIKRIQFIIRWRRAGRSSKYCSQSLSAHCNLFYNVKCRC